MSGFRDQDCRTREPNELRVPLITSASFDTSVHICFEMRGYITSPGGAPSTKVDTVATSEDIANVLLSLVNCEKKV